jgi:hypothetical protein
MYEEYAHNKKFNYGFDCYRVFKRKLLHLILYEYHIVFRRVVILIT